MAMVVCLFLTIVTRAVAYDQEGLAKESQNPIANIVSLPFENNSLIHQLQFKKRLVHLIDTDHNRRLGGGQ
jgi:hypothetical protein